MGGTLAPIQSADLSGIIDRLEKATGPGRVLDGLISQIAGDRVDFGEFSGPWSAYPAPEGYRPTHPYTASVDAAIALAERVLPGWRYALERRANGMALAWVTEENDAPCIPAMHKNNAVALCLAILRALQSKGEA